MAKKSRRRRSASSLFALLAVLVIAALGGWLFFSPRSAPPPHTVAAITSGPTSEPTETPAVEATETPSPAATAAETATPAAAVSPLPTLAPRASGSGAKLALIVDDCGQWIDTERGFLALGIPLTMSVLPDVRYTATIAQEADHAGKGVMLHLPMETLSGMNPGPGKVTTEMTDAQIIAQVQADLDQIPLARGVNNHEGSKASADRRVMTDVIGVLAQRGNLFFVDSKTSPDSVGDRVATAAGVPTASRDVFLDNKEDVAYSENQLREAAAIALKTGSAIAIGHPRPTTLEAVRNLAPQLQAQGIQFVFVSDLVR